MNLMKINKARCKVLHLGLGHLKQKYRLGGEGIESSSEKKDLRLLMREKPNLTWQQAFAAQNPTIPWAASHEV